MFQPVGDPSQRKPLGGNKSISRYFVDTFFLPWCEDALTKKTYDEKEIMDAINNEIKRLDTLKLEAKKGNTRGRVSSAPTLDMKCVAKGCKYTGLNSSNKAAVGVCTKCGNYEHFECSRTKQEDREEILKGHQKYFCSICFAKNPSMVVFETRKFIEEGGDRDISNGSTIQLTQTTRAIPLPAPTVPVIRIICTYCTFETDKQENMEKHEKEQHVFDCEVCGKTYTTELEKKAHVIKDHGPTLHPCARCDNTFPSARELEQHMSRCHITYPCTECNDSFNMERDLEAHRKTHHNTQCPICDLEFTEKASFVKHLKDEHAPYCTRCSLTFRTRQELEEHDDSEHIQKTPFCCDVCKNKFTTKEDLETHIKSEHSSKNNLYCEGCELTFITDEGLAQHMAENHSLSHRHKCSECAADFETMGLLEAHINDYHKHTCPICNQTAKNTSELKEHIKDNHTFVCTMCYFEGTNVTMMENHILEKHCTPDENNQFSCDECNDRFESKDNLIRHYRSTHKEEQSDQVDRAPTEVSNDGVNTTEERRLNEELRTLKNNFQRLEQLFKSSVEEVEKVKSDYEAKITEANDKYRMVKAENEALKEKVDVLFKLGRSYINRNETDNLEKPGTEKKTKEDTNVNRKGTENDDIEIVEEVSNEDLVTWTQNKLRGFKRASPASAPLKQTNNKSAKQTPASRTSSMSSSSPQPPTVASPPSPDSGRTNSPSPPPTPTQGSTRYCHYFVNYGRCNFEERTGNKCKFVHRQAPMCNSGINCTRQRCMFTHPKPSENLQRNSFLGQILPPSPWNFINPWVNQTQNAWNVPLPWNNRMNTNQ